MQLRRFLFAFAAFLAWNIASAQIVTVPQQVEDTVFIADTLYPAVALLYSQDEAGSMQMHCTVTMIEKTKGGYIGVSASHCASEDDEQHERVQVEKKDFFVTFDESKAKQFIPAKVLFCGYQHRGDDACMFQIDTDKDVPVVKLGTDPADHSGEAIVNVASPLGLGKQVFHGTISSPKLERSVVVDAINWKDAILLQLPGTNGGSSGSAIVCLSQHAICALLVGTIEGTEVVALPISRVINLRKAVADGTYKFWKADSSQ